MENKFNTHRDRLVVFSFVLFILMLFACKKDSTNTAPPAGEVWIQSMAFNPTPINVTVNTTVIWRNKDGITHTVTSDSELFDSGDIVANGTFSFKFTTVGTYSYHCKIHPTMTGKVVVNQPATVPGY